MSKTALQQRVLEEDTSSSSSSTHPELEAVLQDDINRSLPFNKEELESVDKRENYPGFTLLRWSSSSTSVSTENSEEEKAEKLIFKDPPRSAPRYDLRKRIIDPDENEDLKASSVVRVVISFLERRCSLGTGRT